MTATATASEMHDALVKATADAGPPESPEVKAAHPARVKDAARKASAAKATGSKDKGKAKPAAKAAPAKKPRAKTGWLDSAGQEIPKGVRVKHKGAIIGTVAYRCTDGKRGVPRIGVQLAATGKAATEAANIKGRTVRNRCFDACELTVVTQ